MFSKLSESISKAIQKVSGQSQLSDTNMQEALREVQRALLDADVALPVVKAFLNEVREQALGQKVLVSLNPGQVFVKIVHDELIKVMGSVNESLNLNTQPPAVILMAGLQGSGKTTTVGKLAYWLKETQKKNVMVASCDIYRPAAIDQLATLAKQVGVKFFPSTSQQSPLQIARDALQAARQQVIDVLLLDTAGRLDIDAEMMQEIQQLHAQVHPVETLFVADSMIGQRAATVAQAFNIAVPLTGIILTKADGDARAGAALSIRHVTGKPIKFIGMGEKIDAGTFQPFYPERIASRILGMGDIVSLVEEAQQKIDQREAERLAKKMQKGHFDLEDFRDQLLQMRKLGGVASLLDKLPGVNGMAENIRDKVNDDMFIKIRAVIDSMTPKERRYPHLIQGSRKRRIAQGSGTTIQDVSRVLKQFDQMQKMMKKMQNRGNMLKMMRRLQDILPAGRLPPM